MNKKFFRRHGQRTQLELLYRDADQAADLRKVDPQTLEAFASDQQFRRALGRFASGSAPTISNAGRATLLAAVASRKSELEKGRKPMFGHLIGAKGLALLAVAGIFAGGAATVGASGGVSGAAGNANDVLSALHITHKSHGPEQDNANGAAAGTPAAEGTRRAVEGIPTDNPQHPPATGTCEKGETIVKTVPSGVAVNVPCQTDKNHGQGNATAKADRTPDADETPGAEATAHAGEGDRTPVPLPTEANPHATEGAGNGLH